MNTDCAVVGVGMTPFGKHMDATVRQMAQSAVGQALEDAGLAAQDVEHVYFANAAAGLITGQEMIRAQAALRNTGLAGKPMSNFENACASGSTALFHAWGAVRSGMVDVALVVGAEKLSHPDKAVSFQAYGRAVDLEEPLPSHIGAGSGYFSWRMAKIVGETGRVYATDIQQEMLDILMRQMRKQGADKIVRPILGTVQDCGVPAGSVDTVILVDVYHELDFPYEMARSMIAALKPGGRLVLVEYRGEDPAVPIKPLHKMTAAQVKKEMAVQAVTFERNIATLPRQHILIFRKNAR